MSDMPVNSATRGRNSSQTPPNAGEGTDRELLRLFVKRRDEAAFAALVARHGSMVLEVCRRVLHDAHEAEDACQATFLVLARKAGSLRRPALLANWLYGVAYRAARKAQRQLARYCAHAMRGATMQTTGDATPDVIWEDLRPVLDGELDRLPAKYRAVVVLCYLEGLKIEEAAQQLKCPRGTVLSRLSRARERLRSRLARRGVTLSAALLGLVLARKASAAGSIPSTFVQSMAQAACSFAARSPVPSTLVAGHALDLARRLLRDMFLARLNFVAIGILSAGLVFTGVAWGLWPDKAGGPGGNGIVASGNQAAGDDRASKDDSERLQGAWREMSFENEDGKADPRKIQKIRWFIEGDGFTMVHDDQGLFNTKFQFRLDASASPKRIDVSFNGWTGWVGIYELTDDTVKLCTADFNVPRPTNFVPKGNNAVWVLQRLPADKEAGAPEKP